MSVCAGKLLVFAYTMAGCSYPCMIKKRYWSRLLLSASLWVRDVIFLSTVSAILRKLKAGVNAEIETPGQTVGFNLENIYIRKRQYCVWVGAISIYHVYTTTISQCFYSVGLFCHNYA